MVFDLLSLSKLDQIGFIFNLLHPEFKMNIAGGCRIELHCLNWGLFYYFIVPVLCRVQNVLIIQDSHLQTWAKILELLISVRNTIATYRPLLFKFFMNIIAWSQNCSNFLMVGIIFCVPKNVEWVLIIPIKAEEASVGVLLNWFQLWFLVRSYRIKLCIVFFGAFVIRQDMMKPFIVLGAWNSEDPPHISRIIH